MTERTAATPLEHVCNVVARAVSDIGFSASWHVRLRAAELLIAHLTQSIPRVQRVRAIVYGRSALFRLGGAPIPQTDAEFMRVREQVGVAMMLLGRDEPHAVLVVGGRVLIELASWHDHDDPGVLIQPFVRALPEGVEPRITVEGISTGAAVVYEFLPDEVLARLNRTYEQMARQLALSAIPRIRWQLDSKRVRSA